MNEVGGVRQIQVRQRSPRLFEPSKVYLGDPTASSSSGVSAAHSLPGMVSTRRSDSPGTSCVMRTGNGATILGRSSPPRPARTSVVIDGRRGGLGESQHEDPRLNTNGTPPTMVGPASKASPAIFSPSPTSQRMRMHFDEEEGGSNDCDVFTSGENTSGENSNTNCLSCLTSCFAKSPSAKVHHAAQSSSNSNV